jgi:hypothetical protein
MKPIRYILFFIAVCAPQILCAQQFEKFFRDSTLRLDYTFAGNVSKQHIYVDELVKEPHWYGRRHYLNRLPLKGNGQITVRDAKTKQVIYRHSFSTLFQEWLSTPEARQTSKSFENVFLIPYPKAPVNIHIQLTGYHNEVMASLDHQVNPKDILIRNAGFRDVTPYRILQQAKDSTRCIHIAFVAEGYRAEQMDSFLMDCRTSMESLFAHEPFKQLRDRFEIIAVTSASKDTGTSIPREGIWRNTALGSHFDTFYSDRYLTTLHLKRLHDVLAGTPYEHIIILVNTPTYGGGGIYNSYNLCYTRGDKFRPVVVHEFGHSFGGLGDEYAYGDDAPMYFKDTEPWEPNLTTKHDFSHKWGNLIKDGKAGMYEGGGYLTKGVFRGSKDCRMKTNEYPTFCPVCQQALTQLIEFYTE